MRHIETTWQLQSKLQSYINVLNHWKIFETTLTTKSNERNQMTY